MPPKRSQTGKVTKKKLPGLQKCLQENSTTYLKTGAPCTVKEWERDFEKSHNAEIKAFGPKVLVSYVFCSLGKKENARNGNACTFGCSLDPGLQVC